MQSFAQEWFACFFNIDAICRQFYHLAACCASNASVRPETNYRASDASNRQNCRRPGCYCGGHSGCVVVLALRGVPASSGLLPRGHLRRRGRAQSQPATPSWPRPRPWPATCIAAATGTRCSPPSKSMPGWRWSWSQIILTCCRRADRPARIDDRDQRATIACRYYAAAICRPCFRCQSRPDLRSPTSWLFASAAPGQAPSRYRWPKCSIAFRSRRA